MAARIVLMVFYLLLGRMNLRHGVETGPARRRLLHPEHCEHTIELFAGIALILGLRNAHQHDGECRSVET